MSQDDLGFSYRQVKSGDVFIHHHGKLASTLRGKKAMSFIENMNSASFFEQQQWMARITGNYKHGNEKGAKKHLRNQFSDQ